MYIGSKSEQAIGFPSFAVYEKRQRKEYIRQNCMSMVMMIPVDQIAADNGLLGKEQDDCDDRDIAVFEQGIGKVIYCDEEQYFGDQICHEKDELKMPEYPLNYSQKHEVKRQKMRTGLYHPVIWVQVGMQVALEYRYLDGMIPVTKLIALI